MIFILIVDGIQIGEKLSVNNEASTFFFLFSDN